MISPLEKLMIRLLEGAGSLVRGNSGDNGNVPPGDSLALGRANHLYYPQRTEDIRLPSKERLKHIYILGATGSGKTKLLELLIRQDIMDNRGFCLIDPHGDLYRDILIFLASRLANGGSERLARYYSRKLVLIEPADERWTVGFNPLETKNSDAYTQTSEFIGIFKKLWKDAYWGPRMEELLRNTLLTLSVNGLTLLEAKLLLSDPAFREECLGGLPPGEVRDYWIYRYGSLTARMQAVYREPLLNRLSAFVSVPAVRAMVGQAESTIDLRRIMDQGQWLLVNLSKGKLKGNAYLLGGLIITKLQLAALSRVDVPEKERVPFSLIVDEFQNFMADDFETILSEARKYGLGLVLAHQNLDQIGKEMRSAILGNAVTQVFFRLSHQDAAILSAELSPQEKPMIQRRLAELRVRQAYLKRKGERPRLLKTAYVPRAGSPADALDLIRELSFSRHGRLRQVVEGELAQRRGAGPAQPDPVGTRNEETGQRRNSLAPQGDFEEAHEW